MIPVRLKMRNFMCYRDNVAPLNFEGIHIACLSGDNGNGKSALIDAMTWALWGKARTGSDDDLVHAGQPEMEVEFDFTVEQQSYRIIRKRSRPKKQGSAGQSLLEFQIAGNGDFRSITGNSLTHTQQNITDVLHMDYDTFINSAFLRQGHADEFTIKRPAERKQVLANILGLSFYDRLEEQARQIARQQEDEKGRLESALREISDELAKKPSYEAELEEAQRALDGIDKSLAETDASLSGLRLEKETLVRKKAQFDQMEAGITGRQQSLELLNGQVKQHRLRIGEYEGLITRRTVIEEGFTRFIEAKLTDKEFSQKLMLLSRLKERQGQLEKVIFTAQENLKTDHKIRQNKLNELEYDAQKLPQLKSQWQQMQAEMAKLASREDGLREKKQAVQEGQARLNHLESGISRLEKEVTELDEKIKLLTAHAETRCPLCETELGAEGLKLIEAKYDDERQLKETALATNRAELTEQKRRLQMMENEQFQLEKQLNDDKAGLQSNAGAFKSQIKQAEEADQQLAEEREQLAEIEKCLVSKDFAATEQAALMELERELAGINYDPARHEQVRKELVSLEQYEDPMRRLEEADRLINPEKEAAAQAEATATGLRDSLEADKQKKQALTTELASLPQLLDRVSRVEEERQEFSGQQKQAQESLGSVKAKLQRCAEQETRQREKTGLLSRITKEENIYRELTKAFGKGGIQALIIEMALPEIEVEANRLLGRMTDNRMHLKFETQRASKKGDVIETLDINISDELGMRNYEMFSGGEAFRINFAIRIALSRLLAHRTGATLPTLIIDEGFGTQDATGIEKLKEAINSIQDDFDKLLVITHIEELRDAFPTRIEVNKTADGSTVSVS